MIPRLETVFAKAMNPEFKRPHRRRAIQEPPRPCSNVLEFGLYTRDYATLKTNISELRKPIPIGTERAEDGVGRPSREQIVLAFREIIKLFVQTSPDFRVIHNSRRSIPPHVREKAARGGSLSPGS